jgi:hypothetical protein
MTVEHDAFDAWLPVQFSFADTNANASAQQGLHGSEHDTTGVNNAADQIRERDRT